MKKLCDVCQSSPAAVHVAHIAHGKMTKQHLCEECARQSESGLDDVAQSFMAHLQESDDVIDLGEMDADALEQIFSDSLDLPPDEMAELMAEVQSMLGEAISDGDEFGDEFPDGEFPDEESESGGDGDYENSDPFADNSFLADAFSSLQADAPAPGVLPASGPREVHSARCAKCGTTWDRLREDGRAGCAYCYEAFEDKLREVMARMQRDAQHVGKTPRAAQRRRRRLEQLRDKRDHRLQMLQRRLQEAVAQENYEDAAALRDKIKMVSSTIVNDEE
jgi:protein-arginine kinase activator protein McsA